MLETSTSPGPASARHPRADVHRDAADVVVRSARARRCAGRPASRARARGTSPAIAPAHSGSRGRAVEGREEAVAQRLDLRARGSARAGARTTRSWLRRPGRASGGRPARRPCVVESTMSVNITVASTRSGSRGGRALARGTTRPRRGCRAARRPDPREVVVARRARRSGRRGSLASQLAAVLDRQDAVACSVHHQRGHVDRGQHAADVGVPRPSSARPPHAAGLAPCTERLVPALPGRRGSSAIEGAQILSSQALSPQLSQTSRANRSATSSRRAVRVVVALRPSAARPRTAPGPRCAPDRWRRTALLSTVPSDIPSSTARSLPAASITALRSSIRSSSVGEIVWPLRGRTRPVPRLSHMITRPSEHSRSIQRTLAGSSSHRALHRPDPPEGDEDVGLTLAGHLVGQAARRRSCA